MRKRKMNINGSKIDLKYAENGPKRDQKGSKMDQMLRMYQKWIKSGLKMNQKWIKSGPKMD